MKPPLQPSTPRGRTGHGSMRRRILRLTTVMATLVMALTLIAFAFSLDRILYASASTTARDQARQLTSQIVDAEADPITTISHLTSRGAVVQLLDEHGQVMAASPSSATVALSNLQPGTGQRASAQTILTSLDPTDPYAIVASGLDPARTGGGRTLLVAVPLAVETHLVSRATWLLCAISALLLAGLLWLVNRVIGSALRPVEDIRQQVLTISTAHAGAHVPVPTADDEIRALAITMNDMLDRLEDADASQRAFTANASHELRSPLTTLRTICETSPTGITPDDAHVVHEEVVRMQQLVDDLLTLAKVDDQGLHLASRDVDMDELVLGEVRRLKAAAGLAVVAEVEPARVLGDELRLGQVLHNLTDNARRHARSTISLRCHVQDAQVVVDIVNDGAPIPVEQREKVFERFTRLQESRDRDSGGSGLGLSIARALAEEHGGSLVTDETTQGWCRFRLILPLPSEQ